MGRMRAGLAAIEHGLAAARIVVLEGEDQARFDAMLTRLVEKHRPRVE